MIGISDLQQIQVIVKLPLHQLLWKSSTRSLLTAGSSTLDMCSTCCILVTKTTASTDLLLPVYLACDLVFGCLVLESMVVVLVTVVVSLVWSEYVSCSLP